MAEGEILVEIALTSEDTILGLSGKNQPFDYYRTALTNALSYGDLKTLARNSLT